MKLSETIVSRSETIQKARDTISDSPAKSLCVALSGIGLIVLMIIL